MKIRMFMFGQRLKLERRPKRGLPPGLTSFWHQRSKDLFHARHPTLNRPCVTHSAPLGWFWLFTNQQRNRLIWSHYWYRVVTHGSAGIDCIGVLHNNQSLCLRCISKIKGDKFTWWNHWSDELIDGQWLHQNNFPHEKLSQ